MRDERAADPGNRKTTSQYSSGEVSRMTCSCREPMHNPLQESRQPAFDFRIDAVGVRIFRTREDFSREFADCGV